MTDSRLAGSCNRGVPEIGNEGPLLWTRAYLDALQGPELTGGFGQVGD